MLTVNVTVSNNFAMVGIVDILLEYIRILYFVTIAENTGDFVKTFYIMPNDVSKNSSNILVTVLVYVIE